MMFFTYFAICFLACCAGSICGIGGGVIIKPVLDALGAADVTTISFLSGCTVLAMTTYSLIKKKVSGISHINVQVSFPLAIGAAVGGVLGKSLFTVLTSVFEDAERVGTVQAACLFTVTGFTMMYMVLQAHIKTKNVTSKSACVGIGLLLGIISAFLGIGGGPINLMVLFYFFSMDVTLAAENSIYIIFFSQIASLISTIVTRKVPAFSPVMLIFMVGGGILGGIVGVAVMRKISKKQVNYMFIGLMVVIMCINVYNFI